MMTQLKEQWKAYLISGKEWCDLLRAECFTIYANVDLTLQMREHFETLANVSNNLAIPKDETAAWNNAIHLAKSGKISLT
jgi:hypothetical protein